MHPNNRHFTGYKSTHSRAAPWGAIGLLFLASELSAMQSVSLHWNPNLETDVAGYRVLVGTSSGRYEETYSVTDGTSLVLEELQSGTDYYIAVQAYNFAGQNSGLSEEIRFSTAVSGTEAISDWLAGHGTPGGVRDDPDGDGLSHLHEFAFGTDPIKAEKSTAGFTLGGQIQRGAPTMTSQGAMYCRRLNAAASGLDYQAEFSSDLEVWNAQSDLGSVLASDGEVELVFVPIPDPKGRVGFFRVEIRLQP